MKLDTQQLLGGRFRHLRQPAVAKQDRSIGGERGHTFVHPLGQETVRFFGTVQSEKVAARWAVDDNAVTSPR